MLNESRCFTLSSFCNEQAFKTSTIHLSWLFFVIPSEHHPRYFLFYRNVITLGSRVLASFRLLQDHVFYTIDNERDASTRIVFAFFFNFINR